MGKKEKSGFAGFKEAFNDLTCNVTDAIEGVADFLKELANPSVTKKDDSSNRLLSAKNERSDYYKKKSIINLRNRRKVHNISTAVPLADISEDKKMKVAIKRAAAKYGLIGEPKKTKKKKYKAPKKQPSFETKLPVIKEEKEHEADSVIMQSGKDKKTKELPSVLNISNQQREQIFSHIKRDDIFKDIKKEEALKTKSAKNAIPDVTQKQRKQIFDSIQMEQTSQNIYNDLENENALKSTLPKNKTAKETGTTKEGNSWVKYTDARTNKSGQIAEI